MYLKSKKFSFFQVQEQKLCNQIMNTRTVLLSLLLICHYFNLISCIDIEFKTGTISLAIPLSNGCSAQINDQTIYILGGQSTATDTGSSSAIIKLSLDTEIVEILNSSTPTPFNCFQNTVYSSTQNKIYIFGAWQPAITNDQQYIFDVESSKFEDDVSILSSIPYTISPCVSIIKTENNRELIYIYGGMTKEYAKSSVLNIFDTSTNTSRDGISDGPYGIISAACIAVDHYFYVFGGRSSNDDPTSSTSDILRYDLDTNQWEDIGLKLLDKSFGAKAVLTPSMTKILIIGGHDTNKYLDEIEVFDIDTNTIQDSNISLINEYGGFVTTGYVDDDIIVLGGNIDDSTYLNGSVLITVTEDMTETPVVVYDPTDYINQGDHSGAVNGSNGMNFFETRTGLLIIILIILLVICIIGICIYRFASKRQGRGYGVVSNDEDDGEQNLVNEEEHVVV